MGDSSVAMTILVVSYVDDEKMIAYPSHPPR